MGSLLSPVLANVYMKYFEEVALGSTSLQLSIWITNVDDTFILWLNQEDIQTLLGHGSSIQLSIQFTREKEQRQQIILPRCTEQGFWFSMYQKPTFPKQYFNFHYPYIIKKLFVVYNIEQKP